MAGAATALLLARAGLRVLVVDGQARRDQLSADFGDVANRIASYDWDIDDIKALVREEGHLLAEEARLSSAAASSHPDTP